jgi:hypothetical protein
LRGLLLTGRHELMRLLLILVCFQLVVKSLELLALLIGAPLPHLHHILRLLAGRSLEKIVLILLLIHSDLGRETVVQTRRVVVAHLLHAYA